MKQWLSDWAWLIVLTSLLWLAFALPVLKLLHLVGWPWWVILSPVFVLGAMVIWALVGFEQLMRDGWH